MDWFLTILKPLFDVMAKLWPTIRGALIMASISKIKDAQNEAKQVVSAVKIKQRVVDANPTELKRVRERLDKLRKRKV
jgi:hypothetical protein